MSASTNSNKNFATGHFDVAIDGANVTAYVKSVSGGMMKGTSVEEPHGPYHIKQRHLSTREIEAIEIELGMNGASWALQPIEDIINGKTHARHAGHIVHADTNMKEQFRQEFTRALITEIALPKLDAKSKDMALAKIKLQPESVSFKLATGNAIQPIDMKKQKLWTCAAFRLTLDGMQTEMVTSVEAMTIKVGTKPFQKGGAKLPEYHPTKIEWPKLSFQIPMKYAGSLLSWYDDAVCKSDGTDDNSGCMINGSIEFLDQTRSKTLYHIDMYGIGPEACSIPKSDANADATKLAKFDCFITSMKIFSAAKTGF